MHAVSETVFEGFAVFAGALSGPVAVAEGLKACVPNLPEVVGVDIALGKALTVDVGTGTDGAVDEDGGDVDSGATEVGRLADAALIRTKITLATKGDVHGCGSANALFGNEVHELDELCVSEVQLGVLEGATNGDDGEDAPLLHAEGGQLVVDGLQVR